MGFHRVGLGSGLNNKTHSIDNFYEKNVSQLQKDFYENYQMYPKYFFL